MRHLDETGQLADLAGRARSGASLVPESVREVLGERVARLGSVADGVLATAAVIGERVRPAAARRGHRTSPTRSCSTILDEASAAALVREVERRARTVRVHPRPRAARHPRQPRRHPRGGAAPPSGRGARDRPRRQRACGRAGPPLAAGDQRLRHERARDWAVQAGDAALAALAPGDAVAYFRQALLLHDQLRNDDVAMRIDLLTKLGTAERQAGDPEHRDTLLKAGRLARRRDDGAAAGRGRPGQQQRHLRPVPGRRRRASGDARGSHRRRRRRLLARRCCSARSPTSSPTPATSTVGASWPTTHCRPPAPRRSGARAPGAQPRLLRAVDPRDARRAPGTHRESPALLAAVDDPLPRFWAGQSAYLNLMQAGRIEEASTVPRRHRRARRAVGAAGPAVARSAHRGLPPDPRRRSPRCRAARPRRPSSWANGPASEARRLLQDPADAASTGSAARWPSSLPASRARRRGPPTPLPPCASSSPKVTARTRPPRCSTWAPTRLRRPDPRPVVDHLRCLLRRERHPSRPRPVGRRAATSSSCRSSDQVGFDGVATVGSLRAPPRRSGRGAGPSRRGRRAARAQLRSTGDGRPFFEARSALELAIALHQRGATGDAEAAVTEAAAAPPPWARTGLRRRGPPGRRLLAAFSAG